MPRMTGGDAIVDSLLRHGIDRNSLQVGTEVIVDGYQSKDRSNRANGRDVTEAIRSPEVAEAASKVATNPKVRAALVEKQRALLSQGDWVAEGRDIGTVVAPDAEVKVFLTANPEERARRRAEELGTDVETVLRDQALRDAQDEEREHSPLVRAGDAVELDTSGLTVDEVVERIVDLVRAAEER